MSKKTRKLKKKLKKAKRKKDSANERAWNARCKISELESDLLTARERIKFLEEENKRLKKDNMTAVQEIKKDPKTIKAEAILNKIKTKEESNAGKTTKTPKRKSPRVNTPRNKSKSDNPSESKETETVT